MVGPIALVRGLLFERKWFDVLLALLLLGETALSLLIVLKVPYTEIDWIAYMQEVAGPLEHGQWDYSQLGGNTGPLVYPAGFVWIYGLFYYATEQGTNVRRAQYLFIIVYLVFVYVLGQVFKRLPRLPNWVFILLCASRRIHSIFMLRCFNDCLAALCVYVAIWLFLKNRWSWGCFWYTTGVSIKMNVLLFLPALGILLLKRFGFVGTIKKVLMMLLLQIAVAVPFLQQYPQEYLDGAFDFGRAFFYKWTVNMKFLSEPEFLYMQGPQLLVVHLLVLMLFLHRLHRKSGGWIGVLFTSLKQGALTKVHPESSSHGNPFSDQELVSSLFLSNFIGIAFAKSLHFQFYVWYFHTLPFLFYWSSLPALLQLVLLAGVEYVWNVFPARAETSLALWAAHLLLLVALWTGPLMHEKSVDKKSVDKKSKTD